MLELTRDDVVVATRKAAGQAGGLLTRNAFERMSGISQNHIYRLFPEGGWTEVKRLAGLASHPHDTSSKSKTTRNEVIEAAKKVASTHSDPITRDVFEVLTGITPFLVNKLFPEGGWPYLKTLAGLLPHPLDVKSRTDDELLEEYHRVAGEIGRLPTVAVFESRSAVAYRTLSSRFGGMHGIARRYRQWLETRDATSPLLSALDVKSRHELPSLPQSVNGGAVLPIHRKKPGEPQFGPPMHFRGLTHAPTNELGVVFLFGIVSYELGFVVEAFFPIGFPDCEAKRCIDSDNKRYQRVKIEFEFESRNFKDHGHDPTGCDLVVCWQHNWPECPIEVLELRSVIDQLEA